MKTLFKSMPLAGFDVRVPFFRLARRMGRRLAFAALLVTPAWGNDTSVLREEVAALPITCWTLLGDAYASRMNVTVFRPEGDGPFPLVVINHGAGGGDGIARFEGPSRRFVEKGFLVLVPSRVGNGILNLDQASEQVLAVLDYGRKLPEADPGRIVLVGWSWGGFLSVGVAAKNPPGVVAAINFAGGFGGLSELWRYAGMGRRVRVPTLWIYTENDRTFPAAYGEAWAKAFAADGGQVDYRLLPAFGEDGHFLFPDGSAIWMPLVEAFLGRVGFKVPLPE
jgi:dienelactone hydrolase